MKYFKTPAFSSIPAVLFLRQTPVPPIAKEPFLALLDTHPAIPPAPDSLPAVPDSLDPFIKMVDLDAVTDRVKAVQQCGSCHPKEYQNWADGPHASSYRSMRKLYETASDSMQGYFPKAYGKWIRQNMSICFQCHATENLYESNFEAIDKAQYWGADAIGEQVYQKEIAF